MPNKNSKPPRSKELREKERLAQVRCRAEKKRIEQEFEAHNDNVSTRNAALKSEKARLEAERDELQRQVIVMQAALVNAARTTETSSTYAPNQLAVMAQHTSLLDLTNGVPLDDFSTFADVTGLEDSADWLVAQAGQNDIHGDLTQLLWDTSTTNTAFYATPAQSEPGITALHAAGDTQHRQVLTANNAIATPVTTQVTTNKPAVDGENVKAAPKSDKPTDKQREAQRLKSLESRKKQRERKEQFRRRLELAGKKEEALQQAKHYFEVAKAALIVAIKEKRQIATTSLPTQPRDTAANVPQPEATEQSQFAQHGFFHHRQASPAPDTVPTTEAFLSLD